MIGPLRTAWAHGVPLPAKPLGGNLSLTRGAGIGLDPDGRAKILQFLEPDFEVLVALLEGALLAMADYLDFEAQSRGMPGASSAPVLSQDALDVLEMLWKRKATTQQRAVAVKQVAPREMRRRSSRKEDSTYIKAAERGAAELKANGLLVARPKLGTWLNPAGVALARDRFSDKSAPD